MTAGQIVEIWITPVGGGDPRSVPFATAVAGRGLEGDRYFLKTGTYSKRDGPDRQLTLIEAEAVEAAASDYELAATPGPIRRNLITRGVALNHLVGREFHVGPVKARGVRLCEPCDHMESLSRLPGIREALVHRGGLRAEVLSGGTIRVGDPVGGD